MRMMRKKSWVPRIDVSILLVELRFTSIDVSIDLGTTHVHMEGNIAGKCCGQSYVPRLDVNIASAIMRFTSVDVSIVQGIPLFIWVGGT